MNVEIIAPIISLVVSVIGFAVLTFVGKSLSKGVWAQLFGRWEKLLDGLVADMKVVKDDIKYLRGNGHETRNRLQQGAVETENIRVQLAKLTDDFGEYVERHP